MHKSNFAGTEILNEDMSNIFFNIFWGFLLFFFLE